MQVDRFFQTTRGKIVAELRTRQTASAADLASLFGLSPNAVRQQLVVLERDGLVEERSVRRGPTKPTLEFSLTPAADKLFPQQYDKMLAAVLREVKARYGEPGVEDIFGRIASRAVEKTKQRVTATDTEGKLAQLTEVLREGGVAAEYSLIDGGFMLTEHNCPYSGVVAEHPEVCSVIHHVLDETIGGEHRQVESLARGGKSCKFEVRGV
ncbi:MAG: helix-turn-helix domain-containing protein [Candidatus Eremiobacteraeota bacterium]|nr:helix-turn-helix domain-containing protein [Candidatus Eremiobacteraeota bacterium]